MLLNCTNKKLAESVLYLLWPQTYYYAQIAKTWELHVSQDDVEYKSHNTSNSDQTFHEPFNINTLILYGNTAFFQHHAPINKINQHQIC